MLRKTVSFPDAVDRAGFEKELEAPAATVRYCVLFTPRSGSSWLTDIARQSGRLSQPGEYFNPNFVPTMARKFNARNPRELFEILVRRKNAGGVFGAELTYFQIKAVFGGERAFMDIFGDAFFFWLIREDIVLQAISLMKKQQTRIAHHTQAPAEKRAEAERLFVYDEKALLRWLSHLRSMEDRTERMIARFRLRPHRMSYERNTVAGALAVVREMAAVLDLPEIAPLDFAEAHQKIATPRNAEMAGSFRASNRRLVRRIERERAPMLRALAAPA